MFFWSSQFIDLSLLQITNYIIFNLSLSLICKNIRPCDFCWGLIFYDIIENFKRFQGCGLERILIVAVWTYKSCCTYLSLPNISIYVLDRRLDLLLNRFCIGNYYWWLWLLSRNFICFFTKSDNWRQNFYCWRLLCLTRLFFFNCI